MSAQTEEFVEPQSNWYKFEVVGNEIMGTLSNVFQKEGSGNLPDQTVYQVVRATVNGEVMPEEEEYNVGIKTSNQYVTSRMSKAKIGQRVKFVFSKEIPPTVKGNHPAKSITPLVGQMDPQFDSSEKFTEDTSFGVDPTGDRPFN